MRVSRIMPEPSVLLAAIAPFVLFASPATAQNNGGGGGGNGGGGNNNNNDDEGDGGDDGGAPANLPKPTKPPSPDDDKDNGGDDSSSKEDDSSSKDDDSSSKNDADSSSKAEAADPKSSESNDDNKDEDSSSSRTTAKISATGEAQSSDTDTSEPPRITGPSATEGDDGGITGAPSLTRNHGIPTYPAAAVPPTINAPFMKHSTAPDGTVFIAVGAILGAFGLALLLWRVISGILLHRSVERAAMAQHDVNAKSGFPAPPAPFYKYTDHGSTMSLGASAAVGRGTRRTNRGPTPSNNLSQSNLFFSPTAANPGTPGNRNSSFLPSGFYAAGSSSPGPGGHGHSISLTNLRPDSRGHAANASRHTLNPSPPDSPGVMARRDFSNSSLNLHRPPSQRAPSAYLDDLLADDPSAFPPPHMPPQGPGRSSPSGNRL